MYALPISDTQAVAIDDADEEQWEVHFLDFEAQSMDSFHVEGVGPVQSAHYHRERGLLWVVVDGTVFVIQRSEEELFDIDGPDEEFTVYSLVGQGDHVYVSGEYSHLWRIALPSLEWEPLNTPPPKPQRSDDDEEQTRLVRDYARMHPPFYHGFQHGDAYMFCGALGALARVRGTTVERADLETGARLVVGRSEGTRISLSADSPSAEIYVGDFDDGFELVFQDNLRALNRTAVFDGQRYIGVAEYPPSDVHVLYLQTDDGLEPIETGTAREPVELSSLTSTGRALWAIDAQGVFRLADGKWMLVDIDDLRRRAWPLND